MCFLSVLFLRSEQPFAAGHREAGTRMHAIRTNLRVGVKYRFLRRLHCGRSRISDSIQVVYLRKHGTKNISRYLAYRLKIQAINQLQMVFSVSLSNRWILVRSRAILMSSPALTVVRGGTRPVMVRPSTLR